MAMSMTKKLECLQSLYCDTTLDAPSTDRTARDAERSARSEAIAELVAECLPTLPLYYAYGAYDASSTKSGESVSGMSALAIDSLAKELDLNVDIVKKLVKAAVGRTPNLSSLREAHHAERRAYLQCVLSALERRWVHEDDQGQEEESMNPPSEVVRVLRKSRSELVWSIGEWISLLSALRSPTGKSSRDFHLGSRVFLPSGKIRQDSAHVAYLLEEIYLTLRVVARCDASSDANFVLDSLLRPENDIQGVLASRFNVLDERLARVATPSQRLRLDRLWLSTLHQILELAHYQSEETAYGAERPRCFQTLSQKPSNLIEAILSLQWCARNVLSSDSSSAAAGDELQLDNDDVTTVTNVLGSDVALVQSSVGDECVEYFLEYAPECIEYMERMFGAAAQEDSELLDFERRALRSITSDWIRAFLPDDRQLADPALQSKLERLAFLGYRYDPVAASALFSGSAPDSGELLGLLSACAQSSSNYSEILTDLALGGRPGAVAVYRAIQGIRADLSQSPRLLRALTMHLSSEDRGGDGAPLYDVYEAVLASRKGSFIEWMDYLSALILRNSSLRKDIVEALVMVYQQGTSRVTSNYNVYDASSENGLYRRCETSSKDAAAVLGLLSSLVHHSNDVSGLVKEVPCMGEFLRHGYVLAFRVIRTSNVDSFEEHHSRLLVLALKVAVALSAQVGQTMSLTIADVSPVTSLAFSANTHYRVKQSAMTLLTRLPSTVWSESVENQKLVLDMLLSSAQYTAQLSVDLLRAMKTPRANTLVPVSSMLGRLGGEASALLVVEFLALALRLGDEHVLTFLGEALTLDPALASSLLMPTKTSTCELLSLATNVLAPSHEARQLNPSLFERATFFLAEMLKCTASRYFQGIDAEDERLVKQWIKEHVMRLVSHQDHESMRLETHARRNLLLCSNYCQNLTFDELVLIAPEFQPSEDGALTRAQVEYAEVWFAAINATPTSPTSVRELQQLVASLCRALVAIHEKPLSTVIQPFGLKFADGAADVLARTGKRCFRKFEFSESVRTNVMVALVAVMRSASASESQILLLTACLASSSFAGPGHEEDEVLTAAVIQCACERMDTAQLRWSNNAMELDAFARVIEAGLLAVTGLAVVESTRIPVLQCLYRILSSGALTSPTPSEQLLRRTEMVLRCLLRWLPTNGSCVITDVTIKHLSTDATIRRAGALATTHNASASLWTATLRLVSSCHVLDTSKKLINGFVRAHLDSIRRSLRGMSMTSLDDESATDDRLVTVSRFVIAECTIRLCRSCTISDSDLGLIYSDVVYFFSNLVDGSAYASTIKDSNTISTMRRQGPLEEFGDALARASIGAAKIATTQSPRLITNCRACDDRDKALELAPAFVVMVNKAAANSNNATSSPGSSLIVTRRLGASSALRRGSTDIGSPAFTPGSPQQVSPVPQGSGIEFAHGVTKLHLAIEASAAKALCMAIPWIQFSLPPTSSSLPRNLPDLFSLASVIQWTRLSLRVRLLKSVDFCADIMWAACAALEAICKTLERIDETNVKLSTLTWAKKLRSILLGSTSAATGMSTASVLGSPRSDGRSPAALGGVSPSRSALPRGSSLLGMTTSSVAGGDASISGGAIASILTTLSSANQGGGEALKTGMQVLLALQKRADEILTYIVASPTAHLELDVEAAFDLIDREAAFDPKLGGSVVVVGEDPSSHGSVKTIVWLAANEYEARCFAQELFQATRSQAGAWRVVGLSPVPRLYEQSRDVCGDAEHARFVASCNGVDNARTRLTQLIRENSLRMSERNIVESCAAVACRVQIAGGSKANAASQLAESAARVVTSLARGEPSHVFLGGLGDVGGSVAVAAAVCVANADRNASLGGLVAIDPLGIPLIESFAGKFIETRSALAVAKGGLMETRLPLRPGRVCVADSVRREGGELSIPSLAAACALKSVTIDENVHTSASLVDDREWGDSITGFAEKVLRIFA